MPSTARRSTRTARSAADALHIAYVHYLLGSDTALGHVRQFTTAARRLGHRVDVYAMNLAPTHSAAPESVRSRLRSTLKSLFARYLHEPKELLWNARYISKETQLLSQSRPDVLLVRNQGFISSCAFVGRRLDLPVVLEMNAPVEESNLYFDEYAHVPWLPVQLERLKVRHANAITVVSSALRRHVIEKYGASPKKIVVVPNGADLDLFRANVPPDPEFRNSRSGVVIGFVGSFHKWHGTALLTQMIRAVGVARPETRFLLVGDGDEAADVRSAIRDLGDRVMWAGHVAHARVPGLVSCIDIGVMPESNFYGSPLKVIEWMAAKRAVVAPDYAPLKDVIDDGIHGRLFRAGDAGSLIASILELVDRPELRASLGCAASARVHAELSWTHNARRVISACHAAREQHVSRYVPDALESPDARRSRRAGR